MKIEVTDHERHIIITALRDIGTLVSVSLANKILMQDPADEGAEIPILQNANMPKNCRQSWGEELPEDWGA